MTYIKYSVHFSFWMIPWLFLFCLMHLLHFFTVITDDENQTDALGFATIIIQWGEIILAAVVMMLTVVVIKHENELMYFINQLINYNNHILNLRELRQIPDDLNYRNKMLEGDIICLLAVWCLTTVAAGICVCVMCPIEPCHVIYKEWFDIIIKVEFKYTPFFVIATLIFYSYLNIVFYIAVALLFFHNIITSVLLDITPTNYDKGEKEGQCYIMTPTWGLIEDTEVIQFYRTLQLFNTYLKHFMANVLVSLHQVACLSTAAILIFFCIKYQSVILQLGNFAFIVLSGLASCPFILVFLESKICGELVEGSYNFKQISKRLVKRKMVYTKFCNSCVHFNIPYAYPFYSINKNTLVDFTCHVIDYTINLLLW